MVTVSVYWLDPPANEDTAVTVYPDIEWVAYTDDHLILVRHGGSASIPPRTLIERELITGWDEQPDPQPPETPPQTDPPNGVNGGGQYAQ